MQVLSGVHSICPLCHGTCTLFTSAGLYLRIIENSDKYSHFLTYLYKL